MNPAKLNHRIRFSQLIGSEPDEFGGVNVVYEPVECSTNTTDTSVTWGSLEPIKQYQQMSLEGSASVLNGDKILVIRYRKNFTPAKDMIFEDLNTPGDIYTIHSILPYWPGTASSFQNTQNKVYKDTNFVFILGIKRS